MKYPSPVPKGMVDIRPAPFHKTHESMKHCIDFALPIGTPIKAVANGVVIETRSCFSKAYKKHSYKYRARTNFITIRHRDGRSSFYAHLKWRSVRVMVRERVRKGQIIAFSGESGFTTYPHLHFGLYDEMCRNIPVEFTA